LRYFSYSWNNAQEGERLGFHHQFYWDNKKAAGLITAWTSEEIV